MRSRFIDSFALLTLFASLACPAAPLPGTLPLTREGDFSAQMVAGIHQFLLRETENSVAARAQLWQRDGSSPEAYAKSVAPNRELILNRLI